MATEALMVLGAAADVDADAERGNRPTLRFELAE